MKITVLIENTVSEGSPLICEHGLSFYIEAKGKRLLLDAGQSNAFADNAASLGIRLDTLDAILLSHGHYDHAGGLESVIKANPTLSVRASRGADAPFFSIAGGKNPIGIPENVRLLGDRFRFVDKAEELFPGIYLVPHRKECPTRMHTGLFRMTSGELMPDDFFHEQSLVIDTEDGVVIFNSCSHVGMSMIIDETREAVHGRPVTAYIGGLHMSKNENGREVCAFSEEELDDLASLIQKEHIHSVYTGHCTGTFGYEELRNRLSDIIQPLTTGLTITLKD